MRRIARADEREVWLSVIERPFPFESPFGGEDFVLMLVANDPTITPAEQATLSAAVVRQGCRYAVCCGHRCSTWDDSIDIAYLETDADFDPPEDRFVMTTWHEDQPLGEVVEFVLRCTSFDDFVGERVLVLLVGGDEVAEAEVRRRAAEIFGG